MLAPSRTVRPSSTPDTAMSPPTRRDREPDPVGTWRGGRYRQLSSRDERTSCSSRVQMSPPEPDPASAGVDVVGVEAPALRWSGSRRPLKRRRTGHAYAHGRAPTSPCRRSGSEGTVYVAAAPRPRDEQAHALAKLDQGLEHQLPLVLAKTAISREAHGSRVQALERAARFGVRNRSRGRSSGLSILTCLANLMPHLDLVDQPRAMFHGLLHVAARTAGGVGSERAVSRSVRVGTGAPWPAPGMSRISASGTCSATWWLLWLNQGLVRVPCSSRTGTAIVVSSARPSCGGLRSSPG
jgi:hypothetical protein